MAQSPIERHLACVRRERRKRHFAYLFVLPLIALFIAASQIAQIAFVIPVAAAVLCYYQARFLRMASPFQWAFLGLVLNILALVYLLGYSHGRGFPERELQSTDNPGVEGTSSDDRRAASGT